MDKDQLIEIANTEMPFGKYKGRRLIDVPEEYLLWFARKDQFPAGHLGELMALTLLIKTEGLTSLVEPGEIRRAIDAGANGYLLKNATSQELVTVIRESHGGRRVLAPEATDAIIAASHKPAIGNDLTQRERELLGLMARGLNNQQIADALAIALPTVKFHITNILGKLQADNRTEAVLIALKHKLVPSG